MSEEQLSEQEQQMFGILHEWGNEDLDDCRLVIELRDGVWEISLTGIGRNVRGVGETFDQAWDNMMPTGRRDRG